MAGGDPFWFPKFLLQSPSEAQTGECFQGEEPVEGSGKSAEVWSWHGCPEKWFQGFFVFTMYTWVVSIDKSTL